MMNREKILTFKEYLNATNVNEKTKIDEKGISNDEIEELINKSEDVAQDILQDKKRKKDDRDVAKEVLKWISGVRKTFDEKGSLHPNTVNSLMRVNAMRQGRYGYINPKNPKIPDDYAK